MKSFGKCDFYVPPARSTTPPLNDAQKTALLARAIGNAVVQRGMFELRDGLQTGLSEIDVRRLFDGAMAKARANEPAVARAAV